MLHYSFSLDIHADKDEISNTYKWKMMKQERTNRRREKHHFRTHQYILSAVETSCWLFSLHRYLTAYGLDCICSCSTDPSIVSSSPFNRLNPYDTTEHPVFSVADSFQLYQSCGHVGQWWSVVLLCNQYIHYQWTHGYASGCTLSLLDHRLESRWNSTGTFNIDRCAHHRRVETMSEEQKLSDHSRWLEKKCSCGSGSAGRVGEKIPLCSSLLHGMDEILAQPRDLCWRWVQSRISRSQRRTSQLFDRHLRDESGWCWDRYSIMSVSFHPCYRIWLSSLGLVDYGPSKNFTVHQILAKHGKYGLENVAAMDSVRGYVGDDFFTLDVVPMKIGSGTGAPCRLIARLDLTRRNTSNWFGLLIFLLLLFLVALIVKVIYDLKFNPRKEF